MEKIKHNKFKKNALFKRTDAAKGVAPLGKALEIFTVKPISNSEIILQPFRTEHISDFVVAVRESAGVWMPWSHKHYSEQETTEWFESCQSNIEDKTAYDIGIFMVKENYFAGGISINQIKQHSNSGNVGYWVRRSLRNQGIALQAVELIKDFGFNTLSLTRLEIVVLTENMVSRRIAEKSGAKFECIAENRLIHNGEARPATVYSLVP